jgi:hypothetical protein
MIEKHMGLRRAAFETYFFSFRSKNSFYDISENQLILLQLLKTMYQDDDQDDVFSKL